jgi:hypothetical protein
MVGIAGGILLALGALVVLTIVLSLTADLLEGAPPKDCRTWEQRERERAEEEIWRDV